MNMYEFNKIGYAGVPSLTHPEIAQYQDKIEQFLKSHQSKYFMLLNNESKYYTLFTFTKNYYFYSMARELISVVLELGEIKSIEFTEDGQAIEFWIFANGECKVYYFFNYERGVIEIDK